MAWPPDAQSEQTRASDAERDVVLDKLGDGFAEGRLSHETFVFRVEATLRARHRDELNTQVADLPTPRATWIRQRRRPRSPRPLLERVAERGRELSRDFGREVGTAARAAAARLPRLERPLPVLTLPDDRMRLTIGREPACDMSIGDETVSRWHADLSRGPGGWRLADLGSTNGTRLNGWRITGPVHVRPGDLVSFGMTTFVLGQPPGACVTGPIGYPIRA
jgi:hypothetical protein